MKVKFLGLLMILIGLVSCSDANLQQELSETQEKLATAESKLAEAKSDTDENYPLVHVVYFKLKPNADKTKLLEAIDKLEEIEVVQELEVGSFEDLGDKRAMSDYQVVMSMAFANEADYEVYQEHEIHLALKAVAKEMLAGPPATYDYLR